jgi:hypothetical protein
MTSKKKRIGKNINIGEVVATSYPSDVHIKAKTIIKVFYNRINFKTEKRLTFNF